jgi:hypothetical protein
MKLSHLTLVALPLLVLGGAMLPSSLVLAELSGACLSDAKALAQGCNLGEARSGPV